MVKRNKTNAQLKREVMMLKKKNSMKEKALMKQAKALKEKRELEKEIRDLKRSSGFKTLRNISKRKLTPKQKANIRKGGKQAVSVAKSAWAGLGKIVNKIDRIDL